ncbi:MAG: hypothetical protein ABSE63_11745 [Thermoguttaceae bacterium]|jgi:hypothetical protein
MTNAESIVESLNAEEIRRRLDKIEAEEKALRVLLRAANRLGRQRQDKPSIKQEAAQR